MGWGGDMLDEPSAGREPRDPGTPPEGDAPVAGGDSGFASGDALDSALPGPALAGFADAITWTEQGYANFDDDELIGVLVAWQKTEAWAAAGRLSAVAELICRRPVTGFGDSSGPASPGDLDSPGTPNDPARSNGPGSPSGPGGVRQGKIPAHWGKFCA